MKTDSPVLSAWDAIRSARVSSWATLGLLILAVAVSAYLQPTFFTPYSLNATFATFLPLVLVAVGQAIVVISGGLDLSLGAIVGLASVVAVVVMNGEPGRLALGIVAAVATGAAAGLVNGLIIAHVRLQPLITTFATSSIFAGATLWVLPQPGGTVPPQLTGAFRIALAGVPLTIWLVVATLGAWLILQRTRLIRHIYAVGGDAEASFASLVPVTRVRLLTYTLAGLFSGLASLALLANTGSGDPFVGGDLALNSIAAVVIGGVALRGGSGSPIGAIAGAIIFSLITSILFFMGVPTTYRQLAQGLIVIAALALSALSSREARR